MWQASSASSIWIHLAASMGVERLKQRGREAARDPKPVPAGMSASVVISTCGVLKPSRLRAFADDRMLDFAQSCRHAPDANISDKIPAVKGRVTVT